MEIMSSFANTALHFFASTEVTLFPQTNRRESPSTHDRGKGGGAPTLGRSWSACAETDCTRRRARRTGSSSADPRRGSGSKGPSRAGRTASGDARVPGRKGRSFVGAGRRGASSRPMAPAAPGCGARVAGTATTGGCAAAGSRLRAASPQCSSACRGGPRARAAG